MPTKKDLEKIIGEIWGKRFGSVGSAQAQEFGHYLREDRAGDESIGEETVTATGDVTIEFNAKGLEVLTAQIKNDDCRTGFRLSWEIENDGNDYVEFASGEHGNGDWRPYLELEFTEGSSSSSSSESSSHSSSSSSSESSSSSSSSSESSSSHSSSSSVKSDLSRMALSLSVCHFSIRYLPVLELELTTHITVYGLRRLYE